ncbi:hypothetical protein HOD08_03745 [bacterium]|nr:hypothetical protein [bacterium]
MKKILILTTLLGLNFAQDISAGAGCSRPTAKDVRTLQDRRTNNISVGPVNPGNITTRAESPRAAAKENRPLQERRTIAPINLEEVPILNPTIVMVKFKDLQGKTRQVNQSGVETQRFIQRANRITRLHNLAQHTLAQGGSVQGFVATTKKFKKQQADLIHENNLRQIKKRGLHRRTSSA